MATKSGPDGQVLGETVQVCIDGVMSVFQSRMRKMLDERGIEQPDPKPDEWYPLDQFVGVLRAVKEDTGENALTKIGESTPRFADWPVELDSPATALEKLAGAYDENHRRAPGEYTFEQTDDTEARITSTTPYPPAWEEGMIKGTAELNGTEYARVSVSDDDGETTEFEVTWR
jgi:uncharacterized protein (TIGR02265 family)